MRRWVGEKLRRWADRIDDKGAPRAIGWSFTFEEGRGIVFHDSHYKGCGLWYLGEDECDKAYTGADDRPPKVLWQNINEGKRPFVEYPPPGDLIPFKTSAGHVPRAAVEHLGEDVARRLNE